MTLRAVYSPPFAQRYRPNGEIGRRRRLKISRPKGRPGSNPGSGTIHLFLAVSMRLRNPSKPALLAGFVISWRLLSPILITAKSGLAGIDSDLGGLLADTRQT